MERSQSIDPEAKLQKDIENKRMFQTNSIQIPQQNQFQSRFESHFNHFLILGVSQAQSDHPQPTVLTMFPSRPLIYNNSVMNDIINFCYPQGFRPISSFPLSFNNSNILKGFVFYLEISYRVYGIAIHIRIPPNVNSFVGEQISREYPFCLCLLSKEPYLAAHFTFLRDVAEGILENKRLPETSAPIPKSLQNPTGRCLQGLIMNQKCPLIAVAMGIRVPRFLLPTLVNYYTVKFKAGLATPDYLINPTFHSLFSSFRSREIVKIYTCLLLELHVVFTSNDLNKLSFCVIAATNLLYPLQLVSKVIPIIPLNNEFRPILDSPFSYIIGYPQKCEKADVIVDIDRGRVIENIRIPELPKASNLVAKLDLLLTNYASQITVPQKASLKLLISKQKFTPQYIDFIEKCDPKVFPNCFAEFVDTKYIFQPHMIKRLMNMFSVQMVPGLADFVKMCFVTDSTIRSKPVTVFNKDLFLSKVPETMKEFFEVFSNTQMFQVFVDYLTDDVQMKKNKQSIHAKPEFKLPRKDVEPRRKSLPAIIVQPNRSNILEV